MLGLGLKSLSPIQWALGTLGSDLIQAYSFISAYGICSHIALLADGIKKRQFKKYAQCVLLAVEAKFNQDWEDFVAFDPSK